MLGEIPKYIIRQSFLVTHPTFVSAHPSMRPPSSDAPQFIWEWEGWGIVTDETQIDMIIYGAER